MRIFLRIVVLCVFAAFLQFANAEPMAVAVKGNVRVTVYDEPCALVNEVTNLPRRATWDEGSEHYEGCFGTFPNGVLGFYFTDKTVAVVPRSDFRPVTGT
jgi:hypothetical protein